MAAVNSNHNDISLRLIEAGATPHIQDKVVYTIIHPLYYFNNYTTLTKHTDYYRTTQMLFCWQSKGSKKKL